MEQLIHTPEFCECDKVTGDDCFIARVYVRTIEQLDSVLDRIADKAQTIRRRPPPWVPGV